MTYRKAVVCCCNSCVPRKILEIRARRARRLASAQDRAPGDGHQIHAVPIIASLDPNIGRAIAGAQADFVAADDCDGFVRSLIERARYTAAFGVVSQQLNPFLRTATIDPIVGSAHHVVCRSGSGGGQKGTQPFPSTPSAARISQETDLRGRPRDRRGHSNTQKQLRPLLLSRRITRGRGDWLGLTSCDSFIRDSPPACAGAP